MPTAVTAVPAAPSALAREHFEAEFTFETDCWDVHDALSRAAWVVPRNSASLPSKGEQDGVEESTPSCLARGPDFVLLDVRSPALFAAGHVPGAINLPTGKIVRSKVESWPPETVFVTYCAGPHCNGAARGALRLAELGRPVKIMAGGITGWLDEGFALERVEDVT